MSQEGGGEGKNQEAPNKGEGSPTSEPSVGGAGWGGGKDVQSEVRTGSGTTESGDAGGEGGASEDEEEADDSI